MARVGRQIVPATRSRRICDQRQPARRAPDTKSSRRHLSGLNPAIQPYHHRRTPGAAAARCRHAARRQRLGPRRSPGGGPSPAPSPSRTSPRRSGAVGDSAKPYCFYSGGLIRRTEAPDTQREPLSSEGRAWTARTSREQSTDTRRRGGTRVKAPAAPDRAAHEKTLTGSEPAVSEIACILALVAIELFRTGPHTSVAS